MPLLPAALTSSMLYFQMVIMAGTVMLAYYFEYTDTFTVNVQGFFCHDSAYRKPYPGPEDSSAVPPVLLYSLAAGVPVLVIIVGETAVFCLQLATRDFENQEKTILTGDCCYINPLVRRTVRFLGIYTFGLFATDIFVNAGQVVTGNLAPHFLALCKPNYTALGCQQYTQFISGEEACTGNPDLIMRARKTFPSKEAALSVYAAMYLTMYITNTIKAKGTRLAKPVLCLGLMCLAFLTGLNRVAEYRNHWSDVIAGFLVGISIAVFLVVCVVNNFKGRQPENEHIHMDNLAQMPMISIPRVESPLEKVTSVQAERCLHSAGSAPASRRPQEDHESSYWGRISRFPVELCSASQIGVQGNPLLTAFAPSAHFCDTSPETRIQEASASLGLGICSVLATQVTWVSRTQPIENGQEENSQGRSFKDCLARLFSWILGRSHCERLRLRDMVRGMSCQVTSHCRIVHSTTWRALPRAFSSSSEQREPEKDKQLPLALQVVCRSPYPDLTPWKLQGNRQAQSLMEKRGGACNKILADRIHTCNDQLVIPTSSFTHPRDHIGVHSD
ncbi:phospholipid phosphatase-related protein type 5 [Ursus maritimus]|uniref:Phospholipid phosphatase-related protein type 5 n=1 Tax=Ursus maritimus TaxID=29073 RepID=A0A8M1FQF9_URSMA|nr:phospholipid phosphatase-related protein type 5 [Ursus maritimus]